MATKVFFYTLRPYDELGIAQRLAPVSYTHLTLPTIRLV